MKRCFYLGMLVVVLLNLMAGTALASDWHTMGTYSLDYLRSHPFDVAEGIVDAIANSAVCKISPFLPYVAGAAGEYIANACTIMTEIQALIDQYENENGSVRFEISYNDEGDVRIG